MSFQEVVPIEQQISDKEKELLTHQEAYAVVKGQILEIEKRMTDLKSELSPLKIAIHQSRTAKERIRTEIEILKNEFWAQRNNR